MCKLPLAFALLFVVLLAGCVTTLNPIYTDQDIIFDPAVLGDWHDSETPETYQFSQSGEKEYHLVYTDENGTSADFTVKLVELAGIRFFDVFPDEPDLGGNGFYEMHFLPVHSFIRVYQAGPTLKIAAINSDWLEDYLKDNPNAVQNQEIEGELVLTAHTADLQKFLVNVSKIEGAFEEPTLLEKGK